jgi:phage minor structural protein
LEQIKLFIFDLDEKLVATLENKNANSCPVEVCEINEALNGAFTLEFELPSKHDDWQYIKEKYFVVVKDVDDVNQLFIIQEIEDSHENELNKRIFCDHASIELADEIIEELLIDRKNSVVAFESFMLGSKWQIGTLEQTLDVHDLTVRLKNRREALETFLNRWGVEVSYSVELSATTIFKRLIHIHLERGSYLGKRLEYGHNLDSIRRNINVDNLKTAFYGLGKELEKVANQENEAVIEEGTEENEEYKRYIDFGGVDWSIAEYTDTQTGSQIVDVNILPSYQTTPTNTNDLNPWTWAGSYKVAIVNDAPPNVGTKSYQVTQYGKTSSFVVVNTAKKKTLCQEGKTYGFSAYVKPSSTKTMVLWAEFYDATGKQIDGKLNKVSIEQSVTGGTWTRLTLDALAPAGARLMMIEVRMNNAIANNYFRTTGLNITVDEVREYVKSIKKGGNPFDKPHGQKWIGDEEAREKWGRYNPVTGQKEHRFGIYKNNDIEDPEELLLDTRNYLDIYKNPQVTYEVKEIRLGEILGLSELKSGLGDRALIIDDDILTRNTTEFSEIEGLTVRAIKRKSDLIDPSESEFTFGDFEQLLSLQAIKNREEIEARLESAGAPQNLPQTVLGEGSVIKTDWLEGEIDALKNEIIAGSGTVTITESNGILIESADKTKALRLLGGMLALADQKDPETGEYNWRSFGTGDGFLADLVQTGFIRFERAKGGTLSLGGEIVGYDLEGNTIYENGTLVVYGAEIGPDGRPIVVSLNGNEGGFDKLSIGELTNIHGTNILTRTFGEFLPDNQRGTTDIVFYVDPVDGNDNNIGSDAYPKATIQACIDLLPKYIDKSVYIYCLPTLLNDSEIVLDGFMGSGWIYFELWDIGAKSRYIRDWADGSTANPSVHWVEIRGVRGDGTVVSANGTNYPERMTFYNGDTMQVVTATNGGRASDGTIVYNQYADLRVDNGPELVDVYFGGLYDLASLEIYHYWIDGRTYFKTKTQISELGGNNRWYTVFDSARQGEYPEPTNGSGNKIQLKYSLLNGRVLVDACTVNVRFKGIWVNAEGRNTPAMNMYHSNYVEIRDSVFFGDPNYDYAVYANGSNVRMLESEVNLAKTSGLISAYGGRLEITNVVGSGFPYGLTGHGTGQIGGSGKCPLGTTAGTRSQNGGVMNGSFTPTAGKFFKAPITQKTDTWTANDTQSLFGSNWSLTDYIYQGKRSTETTPWYGVMFFNASNFGALAGRAIKKVRLKLQRTNNTGENTARKPKVYYNMQFQAGGTIDTLKGGYVSDVSFTWGQEKWITLPNVVGESFRDGTAKSLVLWVGSSESDYMRFEPKATLEITHG